MEQLLPLLSVVLCLWGGVVCLRRIACPGPVLPDPAPCPRQELRAAASLCLAAAMMTQAAVVWCALKENPGLELPDALHNFFYYNIDARHYVAIAQYGYQPEGAGVLQDQHLRIVFFPLFPALLRLLNPTGSEGGWWVPALLVQLPLFCGAGTGLYALARRSYGRDVARWSLLFLLLSPGAFFFCIPMSESLFLLLAVQFVLCLEREQYVPAGAFGLLAGLCRSPGVLLAGLAAVWAVVRRRQGRPVCAAAFWPVCAPALGLGIYFGINQAVYGRWDQYSIYQKEQWQQGPGFFFETVRYHLQYAKSWWAGDPETALYLCAAAVLAILFAFGLLAGAADRLQPWHLAYGLAYTAVTTGATWLLSAPRYGVALFCMPMAAALALRRPWARWAFGCFLGVCSVLYFLEFLAHGPIY